MEKIKVIKRLIKVTQQALKVIVHQTACWIKTSSHDLSTGIQDTRIFSTLVSD